MTDQFRLPKRSHEWLIAEWDVYNIESVDSVSYYESSSGAWRFDRVHDGFEGWRMREKSNVFTDFAFWVSSMEALQLIIAWEGHYVWKTTKDALYIPRWAGLPGGFTVEPDPERENFVRLRRHGDLVAIVRRATSYSDDAADLAIMLTIGLDALEQSILDETGKPSLTMDRLEAGLPPAP